GNLIDQHGQYYGSRPLIEHWDGTRWTIGKSPTTSRQEGGLFGVAAIAPNDVWAVGDVLNGNGGSRALVLHYDGATWSIADTSRESKLSGLEGVSAISSTDVWAVGAHDHAKTLAMHWDGTSWSV